MKVMKLNLYCDQTILKAQDYFQRHPDRQAGDSLISVPPIVNYILMQRAVFNKSIRLKATEYLFINDSLKPILRWWQEPKTVYAQVAARQPDLIHFVGLDLPLHLRWLRRTLGQHVILLAEHKGEDIWPQPKLWLQQFGLRVVDGFIFKINEDAQSWLKTAVILPRQSIFCIPTKNELDKKCIQDLRNIYLDFKIKVQS